MTTFPSNVTTAMAVRTAQNVSFSPRSETAQIIRDNQPTAVDPNRWRAMVMQVVTNGPPTQFSRG